MGRWDWGWEVGVGLALVWTWGPRGVMGWLRGLAVTLGPFGGQFGAVGSLWGWVWSTAKGFGEDVGQPLGAAMHFGEEKTKLGHSPQLQPAVWGYFGVVLLQKPPKRAY